MLMEVLQLNNNSMDNNMYVLVTGASSGIGKEIAIQLSANYKVILNGRNVKKLEETKNLCFNSFEQKIFARDLSEIDNLEKDLSAFIKENEIEIGYFVHCAGIMKMLPIKMISVESINTTFTTNIFSALIITKTLVSRKINRSALKSAVLISSNISNFGAKAFSLYGASKASLDGLMRNLSVELAPKVRINSVLPGAVPTEMTEAIFQDTEVLKRMEATYPLGIGNTRDIFEIVDFLLSEKSRWITGQQFTVDGGRTINITG